MNRADFNIIVGMHNLGLISQALKLIKNFIGNGEGTVYAVNPDGTYLKLQKGVDLIAVEELGRNNKEE